MISFKHKFIFIHIPGTGGTSIETGLRRYQEGTLTSSGGGTWIPSARYSSEIKRTLKTSFSDSPKHMTASDWLSVLGSDYNDYYKFSIIRNPMEKAASLYRFNRVSPLVAQKWTMYQSEYIEDTQGNLIVDDVYRFESLPEAWSEICLKLNIEHTPLKHENNRSGGGGCQLSESVTEIEYEKIKIKFRDETAKYGY